MIADIVQKRELSEQH